MAVLFRGIMCSDVGGPLGAGVNDTHKKCGIYVNENTTCVITVGGGGGGGG